MKTLPFLLFLNLCLSTLSAQSFADFTLECSTKLTHSNFLLDYNELEPFWKTAGMNTTSLGRLGYGLEIGLVQKWNDRLSVKLGLALQSERFRFQMNGIILESDLLADFNKPQSSTHKSDFQSWSMDLPLLVEYALFQHGRFLLNGGFGLRRNLSTKAQAYLERSNGQVHDLNTPIYLTQKTNIFGQIGLGKTIPNKTTAGRLCAYLYIKYFFGKEQISSFTHTGHLLCTNLQLTYQF